MSARLPPLDSTLFCMMYKDPETALEVASRITRIANTIAASLQEILSPGPEPKSSLPGYSEMRAYGEPTDFYNGGRDMGSLGHAKTPLPGVIVSPDLLQEDGLSVEGGQHGSSRGSISTSAISAPGRFSYSAAIHADDPAADEYPRSRPMKRSENNDLVSGRSTSMSGFSPGNTSGYAAMPARPSSNNSSGYVDLRAEPPSPYRPSSQASVRSGNPGTKPPPNYTANPAHRHGPGQNSSQAKNCSTPRRQGNQKSSAGLTMFEEIEDYIDLTDSSDAPGRKPSVFNSLNIMSEDPTLLAVLPQHSSRLSDGQKPGYAVPHQISAEELQMELGIVAPSKQFIRKLSQHIIRGPNDRILVQYAK